MVTICASKKDCLTLGGLVPCEEGEVTISSGDCAGSPTALGRRVRKRDGRGHVMATCGPVPRNLALQGAAGGLGAGGISKGRVMA